MIYYQRRVDKMTNKQAGVALINIVQRINEVKTKVSNSKHPHATHLTTNTNKWRRWSTGEERRNYCTLATFNEPCSPPKFEDPKMPLEGDKALDKVGKALKLDLGNKANNF